MSSIFRFKHFEIFQDGASLKVGTDAMVLGAFCSHPNAKIALDIGTGTGILALMVAQTHPDLRIDALDVDSVNCEIAKFNVSNSSFSDRIRVFHHDIFDFTSKVKYDLIISNPPFHIASLRSESNRTSKSKHFSDYEFENFIQKLSELLSNIGLTYLIIPTENLSVIKNYLLNKNLYLNKIINVYGKPKLNNRVVLVCSKSPSILTETDFLIRDSEGKYSNEYIEKTKCYHGTDLA